MVKRVLCLGLLILFMACTNVFAGGSGNPVETVENQSPILDVGAVAFEYNLVPERMNELNDSLVGPESVEIEDLSQVYGKIIWGRSADQILWMPGGDYNLYAKIGASSYDVDFDDEGTPVRVHLETGPYFGVGANVLFPLKQLDDLCDKCTINWGADIQANFFFNDVDDVRRGSETVTSEGFFYGVDGETSAYLTCKYDIEKIQTSLIPYLGVYHSWIVIGATEGLKYESGGTEYKSDMPAAFDILSFGMLLGLDVNVAKYVTLNVEGRFIGETAITTGATIKF